jgi:4-hydroxy-tetrahydrodipicolinate synthase
MTISRTSARCSAPAGIWVPLVTPYVGGVVDTDALQRLASHLIAGGVHGLAVCGTPAEAHQLNPAEQNTVLAAVLEVAGARSPVMMGIYDDDAATVIRRARQAENAAVAGLLMSVPSNRRPSQDDIVRHFQDIAAATQRPIVLYNRPSWSGVAMELSTLATLGAQPPFAAIHETGDNLQQLTDMINLSGLNVLGGDDAMLFAALCAGGHGAICAAAHVRPDLYVQLYDLIRAQQLERARALFWQLLPLIRMLASEPGTVALRAVLGMCGHLREQRRRPTMPASRLCRVKLAATLDQLMSLPAYARVPDTPLRPALASACG